MRIFCCIALAGLFGGEAIAQSDEAWKADLSAILSRTGSIDTNVGNILNALSSVTANQDRDFSVSQSIAQELHTIATNQNNSTSSDISSIISQDGITVEGWDDLMTALGELLTEERFVYEMAQQNTLLQELITPLASEYTLDKFRVGMDDHMDEVKSLLIDLTAKTEVQTETITEISEKLEYNEEEPTMEEPPTGDDYDNEPSTPNVDYEAEVQNDFEAGTLEQMDVTSFHTSFEAITDWVGNGSSDFWCSSRPEGKFDLFDTLRLTDKYGNTVEFSSPEFDMDGDFGMFCDIGATTTGVAYLVGFVYAMYKLITREYRYYMSLGRDGGGE